MQIGLEEKDIAVEGVPPVLQGPDLGQDLDQVMAGQHTAMAYLARELAIICRATVARRRGFITRCLLRMSRMNESLL